MIQQETVRASGGRAALICGIAGVGAAFVMYWLVLPGVLLGLAAIVLGWRTRRDGRAELGSVAMTLGIVAILLVPAFLTTADNAEDWGRDCALHPESDPNC